MRIWLYGLIVDQGDYQNVRNRTNSKALENLLMLEIIRLEQKLEPWLVRIKEDFELHSMKPEFEYVLTKHLPL